MKNKKHYRDLIGRFTKRPIGSKTNKLSKILIVEIGLALALILILSDLTAEKVANALYPVITPVQAEIAQVEAVEPTIEEHICLATNGENCDVLVNLARCESSLNKWAVGVNSDSIDRGVFQINSKWHPEVSPDVAFDVYASARWTNEMINNGQGHQWTCWSKI